MAGQERTEGRPREAEGATRPGDAAGMGVAPGAEGVASARRAVGAEGVAGEEGGPRAAAAPRARRRNPAASRAAILAAAHAAFAERGYTGATIRDIARRAGVTHGLVMMHFASKEQLFLAAVPGHRNLPNVVAGDPRQLAERVAAAYVERMEQDQGADPLVAMVRSAVGNVEAATRLYAAMQENSVELYRDLLPGDDPPARVELLGAVMIGVTFSRYIVRTGRLAELTPDQLRDHLVPVLHQILLG